MNLTKSGGIGRRVRQGCCLSPVLFNIYAEALARVIINTEEGVKVGGKLVKSIKFADEKAFEGSTEKGLSAMVNSLNDTGDKYDTRMNFIKTKVIKITKKNKKALNIVIRGVRLEEVDQFK